MKTAIWFSRHHPTAEQLADADKIGFTIVGIETGKQLGAVDIRDNGDIKAVVSGILGIAGDNDALAIFGVPSAPIQTQFARTAADAVQNGSFREPQQGTGDYPFFAAWNVSRSTEGGKPTFEHKAWVLVGHLSQASCRWLV